MSAEHMGIVLAAGDLDGAEKLLLIGLTNWTDPAGYCWPSEQRLADDLGISRSTVQRSKRKLLARGLIKSVRRVNPRTGEPISNLTRVNLPLLRSMARPRATYDDDLIEGLTFDAPKPEKGSDLLIHQSDSRPESNRRRPRVNMTPTPSQDDSQSLSDPVGNHLPPPTAVAEASSAVVVPAQGVGQQQDEPDPAVAAFVDGLPYRGAPPNRATRDRLAAAVGRALAAGWSAVALRRQLTDGTERAESLAAVYLYRLGQLPAPEAVAASARASSTPIPPRFEPEAPREVIAPAEGVRRAREALRGHHGAPPPRVPTG